MHDKVESSTPLKPSLLSESFKFSSPLSVCSGDPEQNRPIHKKPPSFDGKSQWEPYTTQFKIIAEMNQWNEEQKGNYLATSLKGFASILLGNLPSGTRQDFICKELVAALESRFGSVHQQELHLSKFKSRLRWNEESLQELGEDLEHLARLAYPLAPEKMKDLLAKEQFIDAILDVDSKPPLKQSWPQSLQTALTLAMELQSYQLVSRQREFQVRGVNCDTVEGTSTVECGRGECLQDDVLAQAKGLLAEVVSSQGRVQCYPGDWNRPQCWSCGRRGHLKRDLLERWQKQVKRCTHTGQSSNSFKLRQASLEGERLAQQTVNIPPQVMLMTRQLSHKGHSLTVNGDIDGVVRPDVLSIKTLSYLQGTTSVLQIATGETSNMHGKLRLGIAIEGTEVYQETVQIFVTSLLNTWPGLPDGP